MLMYSATVLSTKNYGERTNTVFDKRAIVDIQIVGQFTNYRKYLPL